jgi:hypothetical protein
LTQLLVNNGLRSLARAKQVSLQVTTDAEVNKGFFNHYRWRFSKKVKRLLAFAIITVILVSFFVFLPRGNQSTPTAPEGTDTPIPVATPSGTPKEDNNTNGADAFQQISVGFYGLGQSLISALPPPETRGLFESAETMNSAVWQQVAAIAWQYFKPGVGVDITTGLPWSGEYAPYFTDWDLGVYIQAVIDANVTGLIGYNGYWGSSARLEKVVSFLENREVNATTGYPYWFYQARDGKCYVANPSGAVDTVDTGRLLVALNNLKTFNSSLSPRINAIVKGPGNRSDYGALVPGIKNESLTSTSIYTYYVTCGFASFWPNELANASSRILSNMFSAGNVTTYGVSLPRAMITCDPLLCSVFETANNSQLMTIVRQVYLAHEAYYRATGRYRAFSEGGTNEIIWAYEWVVLPDNRTWAVLDQNNLNLTIHPIIFTKIAIGFLAIYNTSFAKNMNIYLEQNLHNIVGTSEGYCEGLDEANNQLPRSGIHTNGMIIEAARYAIKNNPQTP